MNTRELLERYSRSWFDEFVPVERLVTPARKKAAEGEYERDPVRCLMENVEESRDAVEGTKSRIFRARQDGLFDADAYKAATKEERKRWSQALDMIRGDYNRAKSELAHWREYMQWATDEQRAKVAMLEAAETERVALP